MKIQLNMDYTDLEAIEDLVIQIDDYCFKLEKIKAELESYLLDSPDEDNFNYIKSVIRRLL